MSFLELKELSTKTTLDDQEVFTSKEFQAVSRLFIYYNERLIEGTVDQDVGARIRDGVKVLNKQGACRESKVALLVRNSWGEEWGQKGYFQMPYAYVEDLSLAQDFWTVRR